MATADGVFHVISSTAGEEVEINGLREATAYAFRLVPMIAGTASGPVSEPVAALTASNPLLDLERSRLAFQFETGKWDFTPLNQTALTAWAGEDRGRGRRVRIDGYADDRGDRYDNIWLSRRRAEAVKAFLKRYLGLDDAAFVLVSHGEDVAPGDNSGPHGRQINRSAVATFEP